MRTHTRIGSLLASAGLASCALAQQAFVINDRTNDVIWRVVDLNNNGVIDEDEVFPYFTGANAQGTLPPQNPSTLTTSPNGWVAMGDQINRLIYLLRDNNADGDADDLGERVVYADASNLSGASFGTPPAPRSARRTPLHHQRGQRLRPRRVYRLVDLNNDGIATTSARSPCASAGVRQATALLTQEIVFLGMSASSNSSNLHGVWRSKT